MKENDFLEENELLETETTEEYLDEGVIEQALYPEEFPEVEGSTEMEVYPEEELPADEAFIPEHEVPHDDLVAPEMGDELTADDHAMYSAGLYHPEDAEYYSDLPEDSELEPEKPFQDTEYRDAEYQDPPEELQEPEPEPEVQEAAPAVPRRERPAHKGRPRRRKGAGLLGIPHLIAAVIWLMVILAIGVSLGRIVWVCASDVLAFGRESKEVVVSIESSDDLETIAAKLQDAGLIRYPDLFLLYADLASIEEEGKITSGTFTLNTIYDYNALVKAMAPSSGSRAVVEDVLIPEGFSCRQIFALLEEKGVCKASELEAYAASGELSDYWFLEGVERGDKYCLEGFLFPDTYDFYENSSPRQALEKMLSGFEYRFTEEMRAQIDTLNAQLADKMRANGDSEEYITSHQFTIREVVTVASLIEKETSSNDESFNIASVIYNRLCSWGNNPRYLNIDATIIYALDGKTDLTAEDMTVDSPYNTYRNAGLPPTAIANPGVASLTAALNPAETSYYYYVLDPDAGSHIFSKTYEEHQAAGG